MQRKKYKLKITELEKRKTTGRRHFLKEQLLKDWMSSNN